MGIMDVIKGKRIYLDTNVIIYAMEGYREYVSSLTSLFVAIDSLVRPMMNDKRLKSLSDFYVVILSEV